MRMSRLSLPRRIYNRCVERSLDTENEFRHEVSHSHEKRLEWLEQSDDRLDDV
jgi:hypothetical protein